MNILVDTSVWSLALRRSRPIHAAVTRELEELIHEGRVVMIGPIRQEILSGVRERPQFDRLRDHLRAFPDAALDTTDHEQAAEFFDRCRRRGVQGSNTDFLLCAVASRRDLPVFTTDLDFRRLSSLIPIDLHAVRR